MASSLFRLLTTSIAMLLFNESERNIAEDVVHRMVKRAVEMEGTVTGEHGVGLIKRDYLNHELGESTVDAMRRVSSDFSTGITKADFNLTSSNRPMIPSVY